MPAEADMTPPPGPVMVLMYHGLHAGAHSRGHFDPRYSVDPESFRAQLGHLARHGLAGRLPVAGKPLVAPAPAQAGERVLITFDDGDASLVDIALPILAEFGIGAVFFITRNFVGRPGMISAGGVRKLVEAGMVIGSHGTSHRFLNTLSAATLDFELAHSRDFLQQLTGRAVSLLSLPGGRGGARELAAARRAGYLSVFGSVPGNNRTTAAGDLIERVAITRDVDLERFARIVRWQGATAWAIRARHRALAWPKRLIGDRGYDWLRNAWVRGT